jgi:hypothetical protein
MRLSMLASFPRLVVYWAKSAGQAQSILSAAEHSQTYCRRSNTMARSACGLAQGSDLPATVMPFILRDVTLAGVDSVWAPREKREEAWGRLSTDLDIAKLDSMTARARLDDVPSLANEILAGNIKGRMVIDL